MAQEPDSEAEKFKKQMEAGNLVDVSHASKEDRRIKKLEVKMKAGEKFKTALKMAGFSSTVGAMRALTSASRKAMLREILIALNLGDPRLAEELKWGLENAKEKKDLANHVKYLAFLADLLSKVYPQVEGTHDPRNFDEFIAYLKTNLNDKEAELVIGALRGFKQFRERNI